MPFYAGGWITTFILSRASPPVLKATFRPNGFLTLQAFHGRLQVLFFCMPAMIPGSSVLELPLPISQSPISHANVPPKNKRFLLPRYFFESMMFLFFQGGTWTPSLKGMPIVVPCWAPPTPIISHQQMALPPVLSFSPGTSALLSNLRDATDAQESY